MCDFEELDCASGDASTPLEILESTEIRQSVGLALNSLSTLDREILERKFGLNGYNEHTLKQLGDLLKISPQAVHKRVRKSFECVFPYLKHLKN